MVKIGKTNLDEKEKKKVTKAKWLKVVQYFVQE